MHWAEAILLGVVEGLTEFLPVSSTGHLVIADAALDHHDDASKAFDVVIQSGAVLAVVIHYRKVFGDLLAGIFRRDPAKLRLAAALVLATVPVGAIGLAFDKKIKALLFGPVPIAAALIVGGVVMIAVDVFRRARRIVGAEGLEHVTLRRALAIAFAQCVSLWPGSSRSMTTIVGGQLAGLDGKTAADFTFLLSVPVLGGATLVHVVKDREALLGPSIGPLNMAIGLFTAFVVAMLAIRLFLKYLNRFGLTPFAVYRIVLGVVVLVLVSRGVLGAPPASSPSPSPSSAPSASSVAASAPSAESPADNVAPSATASAPSSASSAAAPPRSRRGLFIWDFSRNAPPPERAAELCKTWGVGRVFIKNSEGGGGFRVAPPPEPVASTSPSAATPSSSATPSTPLVVPSAGPAPTTTSRVPLGPKGHHWADNFSADNLRPFIERGIEVWGFGYFYPNDYVDPKGMAWGTLEDQVKASVATLTPDVAGIVVDAEAEFYDHPNDARRLCALLRKEIGDRKLAYTTFGWLTAHSRFPWKEFDAGCGDAFLPQVYYDAGWPGGALGSLAKLDKDVAAKGLKAPVWPIQSNEWNASVANMNLFFENAGPDASIFYLHKEGTKQTDSLSHVLF